MGVRNGQRVAAIGLVVALAAVLATGCGGDGDDASPPSSPADVFGGTPPSPEEFATYPKALPPGAFERAGAAQAVAQTRTRYEIPEDELPPVQAQGTATSIGYPGSCEVWSAGYALGSYTANLVNQQPIQNLENTVSTGFVYMYVLNEEGQSCGDGTSPAGTLNYLVRESAPSLMTVPYYPVCECPSGSDECLDAIDIGLSCENDQAFCTDLRIGSWSALPSAKPPSSDLLTTVKGYLALGQVAQITIVVPLEFGSYTSGVFNALPSCPAAPSPLPSPQPTPRPVDCVEYTAPNGTSLACGGSKTTSTGCAQHGVAIIGYDDEMPNPVTGEPGAIKIMNSFGTAWGEGGFAWIAYDTFEAIYLGGTIALPRLLAADGGPSLAGTSGAADRAFQWVERRDGETPRVHLVFASELDEPLDLGEIAVTAPDGRTVRHTYGHPFLAGYHYLTRHDGHSFEAGLYRVRMEGRTRVGESVVLTSEVEVPAATREAPEPAPLGAGITGTNGQPVR
jgi:hypothetical protein